MSLLAFIPVLLLSHHFYLNEVDAFSSARWDVDADRSYIEIFGYLQVGLAAALLLLLAYRRSVVVYAGWGAALSIVVLDDSLEWHEKGGGWLITKMNVPNLPGLRQQDVGELLVWGLLGVLVLGVLWITHRRSCVTGRRDSWRLGQLVALLMVFAVAVDMIAIPLLAASDSGPIYRIVTWTEAAGELGAMTALLCYVIHIARRRPDTRV